jgi:hypothetical protein
MQCERGNSKTGVGDGALSLAGAEFLHPRGELLGPRLEGVIDIIPVVERVLYHRGGAAALIYGFPEQAAVRRIRRIAFCRRGAGEVSTPLLNANDARL